MDTLFNIAPDLPEGFAYYPDFISVAEESDLIAAIQPIPLHTFTFQGYEAKRKVASFGFDYSFQNGQLSEGKPIPAAFEPLVQKVAEHAGLAPEAFAELLVTEYPPGAVINWHRDAPPFELVAGISLLSDCTFRLRPQEKAKQNRRSVISFPVRRRSLYIMQGPARTDWQHSTAPVKSQRYSITLRTLRKQQDQ
jgi:alkylated DNA repair dioxygenase AlkB